MFYRLEEGDAQATVLTDLVADCSIQELVACFDTHEILCDVVPTFRDFQYLNKRGEANALVYCKQIFPWPFKDRDLCFHYSAVGDYVNRGVISISQSLPIGSSYFGTVVPSEGSRLERMDFKYMYNIF